MPAYDIALLTAADYLTPAEPDWYVQQILTEDRILTEALTRQGLSVRRVAWSDHRFDWSDVRAALFRAVWDYANRYHEFSRWLDIVNLQTQLINPLSIVRWNLDKHYLRDLSERGIAVPQTVYIEKGEQTSLAEIFHRFHFRDCIIKPAISAGARHTYKVNSGNVADHETLLRQLVANETMMIQPFLHSVTSLGEKTLVVIDGKYSHAVIKNVKEGDFRVQDDFGGTVDRYTPTPEEIVFAEKAVAACDPLPTYGRVDILEDNDGKIVVSELELIEPELWLRFHPPAADNLAAAIAQLL